MSGGRRWLPLPKEEGRGEGERTLQTERRSRNFERTAKDTRKVTVEYDVEAAIFKTGNGWCSRRLARTVLQARTPPGPFLQFAADLPGKCGPPPLDEAQLQSR